MVEEKPGQGLHGIVSGRTVSITVWGKLAKSVNLPPSAGDLECVALIDGAVAATFRFSDKPRAESKRFTLLRGTGQIG